MILTLSNIEAAMVGARIGQTDAKESHSATESLLRDAYVLSGMEPVLSDQLDELANDLRGSFPHLTFKEVKLAVKAGIAGELGDVRRPSYANIMRWTDAYNKSAMVADARKIMAKRPEERPRITEEQGLRMMQGSMPDCARRRWDDIRTDGAFRLTLIPHVSAQIYDWLGEEGVLRLSPEDRQAAVDKARNEVPTTTVWDAAKLEGEKASVRSRAKHYALETWMRKAYLAGESLSLPEVKRIYQ